MYYKIIKINIILFISFSFLFVTGCATNKVKLYDYKPKITFYVNFLKKQHTNPVEYIMKLFRNKDIVIIYGRDQREITQFDLFFRILNNQKFIKEVGNIFLNTGSISNNAALQNIISSSVLDDVDQKGQIYSIYRNFSWQPIWPNRGSLELIKKICKINEFLSKDDKEKIYLSGVKLINWKKISKKKYIIFKDKILKNEDHLISDNIISTIKKYSSLNHNKYLIILTGKSRKTGFNNDICTIGNTISKAFPGKTSKVMLNSVGYNKNEGLYEPVQSGKWDAAFKAVGTPALGFDLFNTPFGKDRCRYGNKNEIVKRKYQNKFDGFIFYNPISDFKLQIGVPEIFNDDFEKELYNRFIISGLSKNKANELIEKYSQIKEYEYTGFSEYYMIDKWLK